MKNKKLILSFSLSSLATLSLVGVSSMQVVNNEKQIKKLNIVENREKLDWKNVHQKIENVVDELHEKNQNQIIDSKNYAQSQKIVDFVKNKSKEYVDHFDKNNLHDISKIKNYLFIKHPEYKRSYSEQLIKLNHNIQNVKKNNFNYSYSNHKISFKELDSKARDLKIAKATFSAIAASAAIASAAFWAAAWWFGISIPWATGSGIVSVVSGSLATALGVALTDYANSSKATDIEVPSFAAFSLARIMWLSFKFVFVGSEVTLTATSWAFPLAFSLVPIIGTIISFFSLFD